jgi:hypothetical protein
MYKIAIPKPCFESWEQMTPDGNGRYCSSCAKTVIDFSVMSDEEVQCYFTDNYGRQICGHFKNVQLQRIVIELPQNIFRIQLPFWKKFLVVLLLSYGGSFLGIDTGWANTSSFTQGKPVAAPTQIKKQRNTKFQKRTKKRRGRRQQSEITFVEISGTFKIPDFEFRTTGFTVTKPDLPSPIPNCLKPASGATEAQDTGTGLKQSVMSLANTSQKPPDKPSPLPAKMEFILPAVLTKRRSLFSKKKV